MYVASSSGQGGALSNLPPPSEGLPGVGSSLEGYVPEWRLLEADSWRKRTLSLQRFKTAVNRVVVKNRVDKRRARIRNFLQQVSLPGGLWAVLACHIIMM